MALNQLDYIVPWVSFCYGAIMIFALEVPILRKQHSRLPGHLVHSLESHRHLAFICLVFGGLWIMQNLWITPIQF